MSIYQVRTFGEILATIREEMQFSSSDTTKLNRIRRDVNAILNEIAAEKNWWWLQGSVSLQLPAYISSGTATVTSGTSAVTLTVAPAASMKGYWFAVEGFQEIYRVESHAAGALTLKLDGLYNGSTTSTATFKLWKDRIPLPTDCKETLDVYHDFYSTNLDAKGLQEFRRLTSLNPRAEGKPAYYYTGDFCDPSQTSSITSLPAVSTRASTGPIKTLVFASGLPSSVTNSVAAGDPIRLRIQGAGDPTYNGDVLVSSVTTTSVASDTIIYTGKGDLQESATSDSSISVTQLDQEAEYDRFRELFLYPCLNTSRTTIHVDYIKQVLPLNNDSDEPVIPIEDRMVLVYGALSRAWSRDRNPEEAARNLGLYKNKLAKMAGKLQDAQESPRFSVKKEYLRSKRNVTTRAGLNGFAAPTGGSGGGSSIVTGTASSAAIFNSSGELVASGTVSDTELGYLDGATSNIQTQITTDVANLAAHIADTTDAHAGSAITNNASGNLSATTVQGALNELQTDVDTRATSASPTFSGTITTPLTASRAVVTGASSELAVAATTATEIGYVNGVTSAIQTQINTKAPTASPTFSGTITTGLTTAGPVITSSGGVISSEATLAKARGGTAQDNSSLTFPASGTVQATTPNNHGVLVSGAGATATVVAPDASTAKVLISGGASADPSWGLVTRATGIATGTNYRILANNSSGAMSENAAITASRAVASDSNGQLVAATTTATELDYVSGVTSAIQTQLNAKSGIDANLTIYLQVMS